MPENPIVIPVTGAPATIGAGGGVISPGFNLPIGQVGVPVVPSPPTQIMGFVPVTECSATECRIDPLDLCCDSHPVFGYGNSGASYKNDLNSFMFDYGASARNSTASLTFYIEKCVNNVWTSKATIVNSLYGTYTRLRSLSSHLTYTEFVIDWGKVLIAFGVGCYRIKVLTRLRGGAGGGGAGPVSRIDWCGASEKFDLKAWDCNLAHHTIKLESWKTGKVGSATDDGKIFDLCGLNKYDSIRFTGYFGMRTTTYEKLVHEYQNTKTVQIRNDAVPEYKAYFEALSFGLHLRISIYAMMADTLYVSDYNKNNSDYSIQRRFVINKGDYKPEYNDKDWYRKQTVECVFNLGYRSITSSTCCCSTTTVIK